MFRYILLTWLLIFALFGHSHFSRAQTQETPDYNIEKIRDGIYRTQQGPYFGVVLEGQESLLVFDTFSEEFSVWLNTKLAEQFNKPVKYVIYSHNHEDHVSGGQAFEGHNPVYISHELAKTSMERMKLNTHPADITFSDELVIDFEGLDVVLKYWGNNDGLGSISMYVPEKKFIAAVDWALTDRVMYKELWRYNVDGIIASIKEIEKLDWDLISPGHASAGSKEGLARFRRYVEALRQGVIDAINNGETDEQAVNSVMLKLREVDEFKTLKMFEDWAPLNIKGAYRQLSAIEGKIEE